MWIVDGWYYSVNIDEMNEWMFEWVYIYIHVYKEEIGQTKCEI
jgi:hypothetical protein